MVDKTHSERAHPWVFMVLIIPFGVASGYFSVTVAYQLKQAGIGVAPIAGLIALSILPQTWKIFWAPVVDLTLNQRKWYLIAGLLTAIGIGMIGCLPAAAASLGALGVLAFVTSLASSVLGMAVESMLAYGASEELKGQASGWFQAGNLGGVGIGGGLGLVLAQHLREPWMASAIVGGLCFLCCAALPLAPMPEKFAQGKSVWSAFKATFSDFWEMIKRRVALLAVILCFLPIGTTSVPFAAIADEWHASAETVATVTGVLNGLISAAGCLVGGWFCDRMNRQSAYAWFGVVQAASGIAMGLMARTPAMYVIWVLVYSFAGGLAFAAFSAFTLEAIGKGAAATKYNALACMSNVPIWYMPIIDGVAHDKWSSRGMFFVESGMAIAAALIFLALAKIMMPGKRPTAAAAGA